MDSSVWENGLSENQVFYQKKFGLKNVLTTKQKTPWYIIFIKSWLNWFAFILIASAIISLIINIFSQHGEDATLGLIDFFIIFAILLINSVFNTIYTIYANRVVNQTKVLADSSVRVIRNGKESVVHNFDVLMGDLIFLKTGDIVPAEALLLKTLNFEVNEAVLTGESDPIYKSSVKEIPVVIATASQFNIIYKGSFITNGYGYARVFRVGDDTILGCINQTIINKKPSPAPLERRINRFIQYLTLFAIGIALGAFLILYFADDNNLANDLMIAITLAIAVIPESEPVIIQAIVSFSIKKLFSHKIIAKYIPVIEGFGAIDIICSDKTGTLTSNELSVVDGFMGSDLETINDDYFEYDKNNNLHYYLIHCLFNCQTLHFNNETMTWGGGMTDLTLFKFVTHFFDSQYKPFMWSKISEASFNSVNKMTKVTVMSPAQENIVFVKGSLESILSKCVFIQTSGSVITLNSNIKNQIQQKAQYLSQQQYHLIALAYKTKTDKLIFLGVLAMSNPIRESSYEAVRALQKSEVAIKMLTGDRAETAFAVAKKLNIAQDISEVTTSQQLNENFKTLQPIQFYDFLIKKMVFAQTTPDDKVLIVKILQKYNHNVVMTGDGVNDGPSLTRANVGIAMGKAGTDIAKNAADIIIQNDDFKGITDAFYECRNIYQKIKLCILYLFTCNLAEVFSILVISLVFSKSPVSPINILWFNLVIETCMSIVLALATPNSLNVIKHSPASYNEPLLKNIWWPTLINATFLSVFFITSFLCGYNFYTLVGGTSAISGGRILFDLTLFNAPLLIAFVIKTQNMLIEQKLFRYQHILLVCVIGLMVINVLLSALPSAKPLFLIEGTYTWTALVLASGFILGPFLTIAISLFVWRLFLKCHTN